MRDVRRPLLLLYLLLVCSYNCFSQSLPYKRYTAKEGLSNSRVYRICRDNKGLLWMTTNNGLSCFDGYNFTNYSSEAFNGQVLPVNTDAAGVVWVVGAGGLFFIKGNTINKYPVTRGRLLDNPVY